jgi:hypothetical protein
MVLREMLRSRCSTTLSAAHRRRRASRLYRIRGFFDLRRSFWRIVLDRILLIGRIAMHVDVVIGFLLLISELRHHPRPYSEQCNAFPLYPESTPVLQSYLSESLLCQDHREIVSLVPHVTVLPIQSGNEPTTSRNSKRENGGELSPAADYRPRNCRAFSWRALFVFRVGTARRVLVSSLSSASTPSPTSILSLRSSPSVANRFVSLPSEAQQKTYPLSS